MPRLYSSLQIIKILQKKGFVCISQKGSHIKLRKSIDKILTVIVPAGKKEIPVGTFKSILRQSDLTDVDFIKK